LEALSDGKQEEDYEGRKRADALMFDVRGLRFDVKMSVESVKAPWEPRSFTELRGEAVGKGTQRK